jgi:DNA invertase Pin-like site-specific DNA recombinase
MTNQLAAIYARVSTDEQKHDSGIPNTDTQVDACRARGVAMRLPVAANGTPYVVEEVHSGEDLRWEGTKFMGLVRRAQAHEFTDLICLNIDRFCRGGAIAYGIQEGYFRDAGVTVHYVQFELPPGMPMADGVKGIIADAAQYWKDGIREASMRASTAYAAAGNFIPGRTPPFGFNFVEDEKRKTKRGTPVKIGLEPNPETADALLHMYEHIAVGGSSNALRHWLVAGAYRTPMGGTKWHLPTISHILHNPNNWGERRSHRTRQVKRDGAARRPVKLKTAKRNEAVPLELQYLPKLAVFTPIPGLTKDLAMRALAQLLTNEKFSSRAATASEAERAERGLLFGGRVRCAICDHGMRLKPTDGVWSYTCYHTGAQQVDEPSNQITAHLLDPFVWSLAVSCVRDPAFLERLAEQTDAVAGPAAMAASQRRQLTEAERKYENLLGQLDDLPRGSDLLPDLHEHIRRNKALRAELATALEASQAQVAAEEARRATLAAFRTYAAGEAPTLDQKSPLERHEMLVAMGTLVYVQKPSTSARVGVLFDVRRLPGAAAGLDLTGGGWWGALDAHGSLLHRGGFIDFTEGTPFTSFNLEVLVGAESQPSDMRWELDPQSHPSIPPSPDRLREMGYETEEEYLHDLAEAEAGPKVALSEGSEPASPVPPSYKGPVA